MPAAQAMSTPMPGGQMSPAMKQQLTSPTSKSVLDKTMEETTAAMKELQEEFNVYRREKAENDKLAFLLQNFTRYNL